MPGHTLLSEFLNEWGTGPFIVLGLDSGYYKLAKLDGVILTKLSSGDAWQCGGYHLELQSFLTAAKKAADHAEV